MLLLSGGGSQWCGDGGSGGGGDSTPTEGPASTTRYWDCSGGSCGCGYLYNGQSHLERHCNSNALFAAPANNEYGAKFYGAAAISATLGGGDWLAEGCGKCFKVTGTSNIPGNSGVTTTLVLKATNYCPPGNPSCNGKAHFDIAAPGFDYAGGKSSQHIKRFFVEQPRVHSHFGALFVQLLYGLAVLLSPPKKILPWKAVVTG